MGVNFMHSSHLWKVMRCMKQFILAKIRDVKVSPQYLYLFFNYVLSVARSALLSSYLPPASHLKLTA